MIQVQRRHESATPFPSFYYHLQCVVETLDSEVLDALICQTTLAQLEADLFRGILHILRKDVQGPKHVTDHQLGGPWTNGWNNAHLPITVTLVDGNLGRTTSRHITNFSSPSLNEQRASPFDGVCAWEKKVLLPHTV